MAAIDMPQDNNVMQLYTLYDKRYESRFPETNTKNPLDNYCLHPVEANNEQKHVAWH